MMRGGDLEALGAVPEGAAPGWSLWIGSRGGAAEYLSARGLELFDELHADIPEFFKGDEWLRKALGKIPGNAAGQRPLPEASMLSPVVALYDPVEHFTNLVRVWSIARLGIGSKPAILGVDRVRRTLRTDVTTKRFLHSFAQFELAGAGLHAGADVELEPPAGVGQGRGPGDVRLRMGDVEVYIEVATLSTDQDFRRQEHAFDESHTFLRGLQVRHRVDFDGDLPGSLSDADFATWRARVESAAQQVAANGRPVEVDDPDVGVLTVRPEDGSTGGRLRGPAREIDAARRLVSMFADKAKQTRSTGMAWLVLVDVNATMRLTDFYAAPLAVKISQLRALLADLLEANPHVAGIVWTQTERTGSPAPAAEASSVAGFALQRALPGCRTRQTVIIPNRLVLPYQTRLLRRVFEDEPGWLDGALRRLGHPGGLASLVLTPPQVTPSVSRLWTPGP